MISIEDIARERGIDEEFVLECLHEFYNYTMTTDFPGLRRAVEENDPTVAAERAHSIKGAAQNLLLNDLGECAQEIVSKCRAGDCSDLLRLTDALERCIGKVGAFLKQTS